MSMPAQGVPVPAGLQRGGHKDRDEWLASARFLLDLMARTVGRADLRGVDVLDVGCGTKLVKVLLDEQRPIGRYVGVDVSRDVIDWLHDAIDDNRFEFHQLVARNDLYNPNGAPMREISRLPFPDRTFDLISLFSVFTHLDPDDAAAMLNLLRHYAAPSTKLLFSLHVRDTSQLERALAAALNSDDPARVAHAQAAIGAALQQAPPKFIDAIPEQPLMRAVYDREYAIELVERAGWTIESFNDPVPPYIQHYMICVPA
jgi:SAM-dependent methyltransferase